MKFNNGPIQEVFNSDIDQTNESGFLFLELETNINSATLPCLN